MGDTTPKARYTPKMVYDELVSKEDRAEPLSAPELANRLDCTRRTALNKLNELESAGKVESKKVGGRAKVWWVPLIDHIQVEK